MQGNLDAPGTTTSVQTDAHCQCIPLLAYIHAWCNYLFTTRKMCGCVVWRFSETTIYVSSSCTVCITNVTFQWYTQFTKTTKLSLQCMCYSNWPLKLTKIRLRLMLGNLDAPSTTTTTLCTKMHILKFISIYVLLTMYALPRPVINKVNASAHCKALQKVLVHIMVKCDTTSSSIKVPLSQREIELVH